ncbi:peptidase C65 Otubain-domain-containing protein [Cristinia sonorae]|uniref:ubiquitinyl hydrolase 1 n=1 Tax=Cristinia sonorae TaxID=1940300 RepID=A0A8K0UR04_9AGAR|nr:peptidase C65 Otubain-domain-containing protein [Cristinia sonorae]
MMSNMQGDLPEIDELPKLRRSDKGKDPERPEVPPLPKLKGGDLPPLEDDFPDWNTHQLRSLSENSALGLQDPSGPLPGWIIAQPSAEESTLPPAELFDNKKATFDEVPSGPLLVSQIESLYVIREEYEAMRHRGFVRKVDWLMANGLTHVRRVRPDGDSFYRAAAFAFVHALVSSSEPEFVGGQAASILDHAYETLLAAGYEKEVFEPLRWELLSVAHAVAFPDNIPDNRLTSESAMGLLNDENTSTRILQFLRLLTSATILTSPDEYTPFLLLPRGTDADADGDVLMVSDSLSDFCASTVEPVGQNRDVDQVQIAALSRALQVNFDVGYLDADAGGDGEVGFVRIHHAQGGVGEPVRLLHRPGFYDQPGYYDLLVKQDNPSYGLIASSSHS